MSLSWETASDWDNAVSESGVAHESVSNTDHNDDTTVLKGYSYASPPNSANLLGYWPLHEDSGSTAYDISGNGNDGSINGPTIGQTGILGSTAYDFDGTDDEVDLGSAISSLSSFTVEAWMKTRSTSEQETVSLRANNDFYLGVRNGNWAAHIWDGGNNAASGNSVTTGTWIHLVATWDGSTLRLYEDGAETGSNSVSSMTNAGRRDGIGQDSRGANNDHDGLVAEVAVWDTAFSSSTIAARADVAHATSTLESSTKSFGSPQEPDLSNLSYNLNGESITLDVIGSPGTSSEEIQSVTLDGGSEYSLSWNNAHTDFRIRPNLDTTAVTTSPTFSAATLEKTHPSTLRSATQGVNTEVTTRTTRGTYERITWTSGSDWNGAQDRLNAVNGDYGDRPGADSVEIGPAAQDDNLELYYPFDDGSYVPLSDGGWTVHDSQFKLLGAAWDESTYYKEPWVIPNVTGIYTSSGTSQTTVADITPSYTNGGKQIDEFEFFWLETSDSHGAGVTLIDSGGNEVVGVATDNPQWDVYHSNGFTEVYSGDDYENWTRFRLTFDWANGEVTFYGEDMSTGSTASQTFSLINNTDVESIEIRNYSGDSWNSSANMWYWVDNINIDNGGWVEDFTQYGHQNAVGTNRPAVVSQGDVTSISGFHNTAARSFDGSAIMCTGNYQLSSSFPAMTVMAWVKTTTTGTCSISSADRSEYYRFDAVDTTNTNTNVGFQTADSSGNIDDFEGNTAVNDGEWHHVAGVLDGTDKIIYVDGQEDARTSHSGDYGTGITRNVAIGGGEESGNEGDPGTSGNYPGEIEDFRLYIGRALTGEEIAEIADAGRGYLTTGVKSF